MKNDRIPDQHLGLVCYAERSFLKFEKTILPPITILCKTLITPTFLTLFCCNLLESFKISYNL